MIPGRAELQIAVESLRGSTKRARKKEKACIASFSLIIISPVVDYSFRSKINTILDLSTQTNTMCKIIKIIFIFCDGVDEVLVIFYKNLSKIVLSFMVRESARHAVNLLYINIEMKRLLERISICLKI